MYYDALLNEKMPKCIDYITQVSFEPAAEYAIDNQP
jgi:hypothetical protein